MIGSLFAQYGTLRADIDSAHGNGRISGDGYGVGAALTWHGTRGTYVDGLAQATWLKSDLDSDVAGALTNDNSAHGYGLSLEAGHALPISANLSVTPQAQLTYTGVRFDDFVDPFGATISLAESDLLQGRLGISLDHNRQWMDADGRAAQRRLYGLANLLYAFDGENTALVSGTAFRSTEDRVWGGLGLGTAYNFGGGRHTLFLEGSANTSLENFGDSYTFNATLGWRIAW